MLEKGCRLDVVNSAGDTVLHWATESGDVELVTELVGRGCDVNAVKANGCTPLHDAAICGRTEALHELIKLGAAKSVVAGRYGTPLHQAIVYGNVETIGALLDDEASEPELASHDVTPSKVPVLDSGIVGTCNSLGQTPVMWAIRCGEVEVLKLLTSRGGSVMDRDAYSLSAFEHTFISGQASKLNKFCKASGIRSSGEGLRGALATLITQGLVDAHKVLSLCAISGDTSFLHDEFIELVASDVFAVPAALKGMRHLFFEGVQFLDQLRIPDENALNPLHISLLSLKCFQMGFAVASVQRGAKDHASFITKLLSHPVLKTTVHENFPNDLSPLDLAQQLELHHIAALIEVAGGRPGVWADIPRDVFLSCCNELFSIYLLLKKLCDTNQGGREAVTKAVMKFLDAQTLESVVQVADDSRLVKEQVLGQRPDLGDIVTHVIPHIQVRSKWKSIGLAVGIKKSTLDQFSNEDDPYLETLSCWLEHGSSVTWMTLLDVLGRFETKHTVDELTAKILSVLGGGIQVLAPFRRVSNSAPVVSEGAVVSDRRQPVCEANQVLGDFRDQFIANMVASTVVWELLYKDIIPRGVQERISRTDEPKQRNEILHNCLQRTCTTEALMDSCNIIVAVKGHPKMRQLGEAMKWRLCTGTLIATHCNGTTSLSNHLMTPPL